MKVSLVILTWNRWPSLEKSLRANIASAGYPLHEIVHVDNGSEPGFNECFRHEFKPSVQVLHAENQGVATGYNRGLALATGSHVVITGCDRVMPYDWLNTFVSCFQDIPETGVVSCYSGAYPERIRGSVLKVNGLEIQRAIPVEARMHSKDFLFGTGFWREEFFYGYEDSEWADRAERYAAANGMLNYVVPGMGLASHLSETDFTSLVGGLTYRQFKDKHHGDPRARELWLKCNRFGSPHYNPYARTEVPL